MLRTAQPLFRLPRGSTPRSIRERVDFLSLLACSLVRGQRIIGQPEKRIIRGAWLGSSAAYQTPQPLLYRWAGKGELLQQQLPSATLNFSAQANTGADHTIHKLYLNQEWRGQSDIFDIHAVHANQSTPSLGPLTGKRIVASLLGHSRLVVLCSLVFSQVGDCGLRQVLKQHQVACVCRSGNPG